MNMVDGTVVGVHRETPQPARYKNLPATMKEKKVSAGRSGIRRGDDT
jgi:hypothetical protein